MKKYYKNITDTVVIVPAFNESKVIYNNLINIKKYGFENIILVDDCSTDNTVQEAKKAKVDIVKFPINNGCGAATITGIKYSLINYPNAKYFATIDADGQHNPNDLIKMRKRIIANNNDIILGSRFLKKKFKSNLLKKIILKNAVKFQNSISKSKFSDTHNGLRIINRYFAKTISLNEPGYQFCSELVDKIIKDNYKYTEYPVSVKYTNYSKQKGQRSINAINIAVDTIIDKFFSKW